MLRVCRRRHGYSQYLEFDRLSARDRVLEFKWPW